MKLYIKSSGSCIDKVDDIEIYQDGDDIYIYEGPRNTNRKEFPTLEEAVSYIRETKPSDEAVSDKPVNTDYYKLFVKYCKNLKGLINFYVDGKYHVGCRNKSLLQKFVRNFESKYPVSVKILHGVDSDGSYYYVDSVM